MSYLLNTPLINYFKYKQATNISSNCGDAYPVSAIADGGNGQLIVTTANVDGLSAGIAITLTNMSDVHYDGNYSVISMTPTTFLISGVFSATATGVWSLSSAITAGEPGEALDEGKLSFYDAINKTELLDTYSDSELTNANTNPLVLDSIGSAPPIYMQNTPYYIEIHDKFNNLISTLENYLPSGASTSEDTLDVQNLFPSYGFDSIIDNGNYSEIPLPVDSNGINTVVSSGWRWEFASTSATIQHTYSFASVGFEHLIGSPKNELKLNVTNASAGDSKHYFGCIIGDYSSFQGNSCSFSCFVSSTSSSNLPIYLRWTHNGAQQAPISKGVIPVTAIRTQQILSFAIDDLPAGTYSNSDTLEFLIGLPLNTDFALTLTGTWLQLSSDEEAEEVTIEIPSIANTTSSQILGDGFRPLQNNPSSPLMGLPLTLKDGTLNTLNNTGVIFVGQKDMTYDYATSLDNVDGTLLLADTPYGLGSSNPLIESLRKTQLPTSLVMQSYDVPLIPGEFNVYLSAGDYRTGGITISAGSRITSTSTDNGMSYGLKGHLDSYSAKVLRVVFTDQFNADTAAGYGVTTPPIPSVMINWFGVIDEAKEDDYFSPNVGVHKVHSGSASTNAEALIMFTNNSLKINSDARSHLYCFESALWAAIPIGYFGYNDITNNPATQGTNPPRAITYTTQYSYNTFTPQTGLISSLDITVPAEATAQEMALLTKKAVNNSWVEHLKIVTVPENGDYIEFPLSTNGFVLVYWDTEQPKPSNPVANYVTIYVEVNSTDTIADVVTATVFAINNTHAGVPYWRDLGLPELFNDEFTYYITN